MIVFVKLRIYEEIHRRCTPCLLRLQSLVSFTFNGTECSSPGSIDGMFYIITRNRVHFKPFNNCQRYIMLHCTTIKSKLAAVFARSERKRISTPNTPNIDESISSPQIEFVDSYECLP